MLQMQSLPEGLEGFIFFSIFCFFTFLYSVEQILAVFLNPIMKTRAGFLEFRGSPACVSKVIAACFRDARNVFPGVPAAFVWTPATFSEYPQQSPETDLH